MALIDRYLELAISQKASDIHFSTGQSVRMRVDGDLVSLDESALSAEQLEMVLLEVLGDDERERFGKFKNLDKSYTLSGVGNFRMNFFQTRNGISAVIRTIPSKIPTIQQLGLPDVVLRLTELKKGLVLVTGPTGSGKSTTLAAMINHINVGFPHHILTAEDPVEFVHTSQQSLINQREIGASCPTFADALKYALREDPDVILVGEMRDLETIALALTAAETGHLVFGTLHTRGAAASIDRIIDSFPGNQQAMIRAMLADSLAAVISQALLKRADGEGRVAAYEIMVVNHAISNLIREGKTFQIQSIIQTARKEGMILLDSHIKDLVAKNIVNREEAAAYLDEGAGKKSLASAVAASPISRPSLIRTGFSSSANIKAGVPPLRSGVGGPPPMKKPGAPSFGGEPRPNPMSSPAPAAMEPDEVLGDDGGEGLDFSVTEDTGNFQISSPAAAKSPVPPPAAKPRPLSVPAPGAVPGAKNAPLPPPPSMGKKKVG